MPQPWLEAAQVLDGSAAAPHLSVRTTPLAPRDAAHLGLAATVPPAPSGQGPLTAAPPSPAPDALLRLATGREDVTSWVRHGRGLVGLGRTLELRARGASRIEQMRAAWRQVVYASWWSDPLVRPGTGPVALGTLTFSPGSGQDCVLLVPRLLIGLDDDGAWLTTAVLRGEEHPDPAEVVEELIAAAATAPSQETSAQGARAVVEPGSHDRDSYLDCLSRVQARMRSGEVAKVVIARDLLVRPATSLGTPELLGRLAQAYPSCWTFAVDGMVGASPELLVRLSGRRLTSRVLAGTARRHATEPGAREREAARLAAWLEGSQKNNREHALARASALKALEPLCSVVQAPPRHVITLPNVLHLASDVTGVVAGDTGTLSLVGALHPTAAVGGTPTPAALAVIEAEEGMDRGRYAGPVGWVDWHGEGEWCIALRSGQLSGAPAGPQAPVRVFGGGGIMPDSEPGDELAETEAKMRPMLAALGA
ncbi:MAG: isochorismate synthase [Actinomyces urogenitalis]|nr:isochorismate synthase [Actinomyces urogenitalis]